NALGSFESRLFIAHPCPGHVPGWSPCARANGTEPERTLFQFQRHGRSLAKVLHRGSGWLALRYIVRRSRSQLSRSARGMEVYFPSRCRDAGRVAGRHERVQIATAPLDQGFNSNLQKIAATDLAE